MKLRLSIAIILATTTAGTLVASPANDVRTRVAGYRALGAAFKSANDAVRRRDFADQRLRNASARIVLAARRQYSWYPAASRPTDGLKTAAKPEIWSNPDDFRTFQDAFLAQARRFHSATSIGEASAIRSEARRLGAQCKACHDRFRRSDD